MGNDSASEKTELPTPKKIRDAREKGQVRQSKEVVTTAAVTALFSYLYFMFPTLWDASKELMLAPSLLYDMPFIHAVDDMLYQSGRYMVQNVVPFLLIVIAVVIAASVCQFGFLFSMKAIVPSLEKVSPMAGMKRIFAIKNLIEFLKSIVKMTALSIALGLVLYAYMQDLLFITPCGLNCIGPTLQDIIRIYLIIYILISLAVAAFDFWFQDHQYTKELMMTKDEVKREYKESEGDPLIKDARKQQHREILEGDGGPPEQSMPDAKALVVNPTHVAVAIFYDFSDEGATTLPKVTCKGVGQAAHRLMELAEIHEVPIVRNILLARGLYEKVKVGRYIPSEFIEPVTEVLQWVYDNYFSKRESQKKEEPLD